MFSFVCIKKVLYYEKLGIIQIVNEIEAERKWEIFHVSLVSLLNKQILISNVMCLEYAMVKNKILILLKYLHFCF